MSYKFQIGSAALSGAVFQKLGTATYNQYVFQNDAGTTKVLITAHGVVSGSALHLQASASVQDRLTAGGLTDSSLTNTRVVFAGAGGALSGDAGMAFASDTLTVTKLGAYEQAGAVDFSDEAMTNVNIDSGVIDGTTVGATSATTGKFTTLSASSTLNVVGVANFGPANKVVIAADGGLTIVNFDANWTNAGRTVADLGIVTTVDINGGSIDAATIGAASQSSVKATTLSASSTLSVAGAVQLDGADDSVAFVAADNIYFRDAGTGQVRRDSWSDLMTVAAGTVTTTGLAASSGVLGLDIANMTAATIATTDTIVFNDQTGDVLRQETVDDLFTKGPALATEAVFSVANDYINFLDGGSTGDAKKEQWADIVALMAGAGLTATAGVLASDASPTPNKLVHGETLSEGLNWATGSKNATVYLPQGADFGDTIRVKSAALANGKALTIGIRAGSGTTIDGEASVALRSQYGAVTFIYAVTGSWLIV